MRGRIREIAGPMLDTQGATFACHKTTGVLGNDPKHLHCAGALIFAEKHQNATQMMRIAERLGAYDAAALMGDAATVAAIFDSIEEMEETAWDAGSRKVERRKRARRRQ